MASADPLIEGMALGSDTLPAQPNYFDDLNAVRMYLYQSPIKNKHTIAQRKRGTYKTFPSADGTPGDDTPFLIQSLSQAVRERSGYSVEIDHNMLIELHALSYEKALRTSSDLMMMLAAGDGRSASIPRNLRGRGLVLPYWDMTQQPPVIVTDDWWEQHSNFPQGSVPRLGVRILQETVVVNHEQEDNENADIDEWHVSCTFRMLAPRVIYDVTLEQPLTEVKLTGVFSG